MPPPLINQSQTISSALGKKSKSRLLEFARESIRAPASTGAVAPSSRFVAEKVMQLADLQQADLVVELGPGTGVFTEQIQCQLRPKAVFFALELNKIFVEAARKRCPSVRIYHDTADALPSYLQRHNWPKCDCIISSLPLTIFESAEQDRLLETISASLKPGGKFISIVYVGAKTRVRGRYFINNLPLHFRQVERSKTIWRNLPPTEVYCCRN